MRLIDADALKEDINNAFLRCLDMQYVKDIIDNAPTVDTTCPNCDSGYAQGYSDGYLKGKEERPQGEWITICTLPIIRKCSLCGVEQSGEVSIYDNFCPNCGAKMTKEAENEI